LRERPRSSICIDQILNRFVDTYCGEAARRFWPPGVAIAQKFKNARRALTQRLRSNKQQTNIKQTTQRMTIWFQIARAF
jgi:hypothetical protein